MSVIFIQVENRGWGAQDMIKSYDDHDLAADPTFCQELSGSDSTEHTESAVDRYDGAGDE